MKSALFWLWRQIFTLCFTCTLPSVCQKHTNFIELFDMNMMVSKTQWSTSSVPEPPLAISPFFFFFFVIQTQKEGKVFQLWLVQAQSVTAQGQPGEDRNIKRSAGNQQLQVGSEPDRVHPAPDHLRLYQHCFNLLAGSSRWLTDGLNAWMNHRVWLLDWLPGWLN